MAGYGGRKDPKSLGWYNYRIFAAKFKILCQDQNPGPRSAHLPLNQLQAKKLPKIHFLFYPIWDYPPQIPV